MEFNPHQEKFSSPEQELAHLKEQVAIRERELAARGARVTKEEVIHDKIQDYRVAPANAVLHESHAMPKTAIEDLALNLKPELHDVKIQELLRIMNEKGIKNVLGVVDALNDPHVEDNFHRFLVQYLKKGYDVPGLKPKSALFQSLRMTLYEIALPRFADKPGEKEKSLKELVSAMEQFYAGMLAVSDRDHQDAYATFEIANPNRSEELIFYASIPDNKKDLFEKQVLSLFHEAKVREVPDDYNIFNEGGVTVGSVAELSKHPIFPIKWYEEFDHDPLAVILNTFSKIRKEGQGAALQMVFRPSHERYYDQYVHSLHEIEKGESVKKALPKSIAREIFSGLKDVLFSSEKKEEGKEEKPKPVDQVAVKNIQNKIASPIAEVNIRLLVSAHTQQEASAILSDIESSFKQFENPTSNAITFRRLVRKSLRDLIQQFAFRSFSALQLIPMNLKEIATLFHLPGHMAGATPQLKQSKAGAKAAPVDLPREGTLLGVNRFRNLETPVYIAKEDRLRHFYTIGQTGTGKSTLLKNMAVQDIQQGEGVCVIDPHGVDILDILAAVPPERYEDVIYFDPSYTPRPMGLNMLEYDLRFPEQKTFVVNELFSIFKKLYGNVPESMGPAFEQYFRNSALLVMEDPGSGNTLVDISRVLSDRAYRDYKLARCKNPLIRQFWENAQKTTGDQGLANYVQYVTNKFDVFLANDIMRPIISQETSSFNFRDIMDNRKILLVNLAKGRLGDINSHLIGLILVGKILMAALSRADSIGKDLPPFYLYIDEFQNITTDSIATILSEARKYKLSLSIAHQFIAQLDEGTKNAVFGNVGSLAAFRVGSADAEFLEKQFAPDFTAQDLMNIDNRNAYVKLLIHGHPVQPFNIETMAPAKTNPEKVAKLQELSYLKYGKDKAQVETEVMKKYQKTPAPAPASAPVAQPKV